MVSLGDFTSISLLTLLRTDGVSTIERSIYYKPKTNRSNQNAELKQMCAVEELFLKVVQLHLPWNKECDQIDVDFVLLNWWTGS